MAFNTRPPGWQLLLQGHWAWVTQALCLTWTAGPRRPGTSCCGHQGGDGLGPPGTQPEVKQLDGATWGWREQRCPGSPQVAESPEVGRKSAFLDLDSQVPSTEPGWGWAQGTRRGRPLCCGWVLQLRPVLEAEQGPLALDMGVPTATVSDSEGAFGRVQLWLADALPAFSPELTFGVHVMLLCDS